MEFKTGYKDILFFLLMAMAMLFWGGSWIAGKLVSSTALPFVIVFWRFLFSFISFLPAIVIYTIKNRKIIKPMQITNDFLYGIGWTAVSAIVLIAYNHLFFNGLKTGLAGKGGVIVTTINPLFALIIGSAFSKEPLFRNQKTGLVLGLIGGILLIAPWRYSLKELLTGGNLFFLAAALAWAILTNLSAHAQQRVGTITYNTFLYGIATIINLIIFGSRNYSSVPELSTGFWLNTLYLALFAGSIGTGLYFLAAKRIGSGRAGSFTFLVPLSSVFLAWIILKEVPELTTLAGGILGITSVWLINKRRK